jgi:hypothetical protein
MTQLSRDYLFHNTNLDDRLRLGHQGAADAVQAIPEAQLLASSDDEIVAHIESQWMVQALILHEEAATMNKRETNVNVSGDYSRGYSGKRGPVYVPGTEVTIRLPYTGTTWLWQATTNPFVHTLPVGTVHGAGDGGGTVELKFTLPHDAPPQLFKKFYDDTLQVIRQFIEWGTVQVNSTIGGSTK